MAMIRPDGGSWSGSRDRFGERAAAVDADGRPLELLRLFASFTSAHPALADRLAQLDVDRPAVARTFGIERDHESARLILVSEPVPGLRLADLLQAAVEKSVVADLGAALFVMRRLLTIAESLQAATGVTEFSIGPERIVITPHARVVIVEPVLAAATAALASRRTDIAGIAVAGMSIMLGHLIDDAEQIDPLSPVLQDAAEVAAIRAGDRFSTALRLWFDQAIVADPALSFPDFRQARLALSRVLLQREPGCDASRRALKAFLGDLAIEPLIDPEAARLETSRSREIRARQRARLKAIAAPDAEWIPVAVEEPATPRDEEIEEPPAEIAIYAQEESTTEAAPDFSDAPVEQDEAQPTSWVEPASEPALSEDAHTSWIRAVTEQIGLARREENVAEAWTDTTEHTAEAASVGDETEAERITEAREEAVTLGPDEAAQFPESESFVDDEPEPAEWIPPYELVFKPEGVQAADTEVIQPPPAGRLNVEEHSEPPTTRATLEFKPLREDASPAGAATPIPGERVAHVDAARAKAADAQRTRRATQPATAGTRRRSIVVPIRKLMRAAATILMAGLSLSIVVGLVAAGRRYYARATTPGTVAVASIPAGSQVLVDGTPRGMTPLTLTLSPGNHVLELRRNGVARQFPIAMTPGAELSHRLDWSTVKPTGTLVVASAPPGARVIVDGKERGLTPLTIPDLPIGRRRVVIDSSAGTVRRDVTVVADGRVTLSETIISGWIAAFAPFELQIYEGTRLLGTTEEGRIMVPPGRHELDFVNTRLGYRERRGVEVTPGATTAVNITSVVGTVRINAAPGAEVLIDGVHMGETPVGDLRVPIGTHEIVLRHAQLGEQRVSVTVGASVPAEVNVDFTSR